MGEDLQSMMCAGSLAVAKSTLRYLIAFHTTAERIYFPTSCDEELEGVARAWPNKKVYGLSWPDDYSVYGEWKNSPKQLDEMMNYTGITGFTQCLGGHR